MTSSSLPAGQCTPPMTRRGTAWHWEWISGIALAICIWVGAHFHGPPRTTLTVMLNWFPLGQAGEQFTESQWESCGDGRCYSGGAEEGLCLQSRLGDIRAFLLEMPNALFLKEVYIHWCQILHGLDVYLNFLIQSEMVQTFSSQQVSKHFII